MRELMNLALDAGVPAVWVRETIFTIYLFDGYPAALEGFRILHSIAAENGRAGDSEFDYSPANITLWHRRGELFCRAVYGGQYERLINHVREIAPELGDSMIVEGYGRVLSRESLEPKLREMIVVAVLASKYRPRQLLSHSLGALRLGATFAELRDIGRFISDDATAENTTLSMVVIEDAIRRFDKS